MKIELIPKLGARRPYYSFVTTVVSWSVLVILETLVSMFCVSTDWRPILVFPKSEKAWNEWSWSRTLLEQLNYFPIDRVTAAEWGWKDVNTVLDSSQIGCNCIISGLNQVIIPCPVINERKSTSHNVSFKIVQMLICILLLNLSMLCCDHCWDEISNIIREAWHIYWSLPVEINQWKKLTNTLRDTLQKIWKRTGMSSNDLHPHLTFL